MGNDFALAVLSDKAPALYGYFKQLFAQVTNPPIDPIRERVVMSLETAVGPQANLFESSPEHAHQLIIGQPLLRNFEIEKLKQVDHHVFSADVLDATWPVEEGPEGMARAMERLCRESSELIAKGDNIIVISDRAAGADRAPIPALLATAGVHHHLVREGTRLQTGLVVESAEPREVHHICCLLGYGASAVNPYLALETLRDMFDQGLLPGIESADDAEQNYVTAMGKGILKTISKMGISTVRSYAGAQIFEAVGLNNELIDTVLHAHDVAHRRHRHRRAGDRGARAAPARLPGDRGAAAGRRRAPVAALRRAAPVEPRDDRARPARGAARRAGDLRRVLEARERRVARADDAARPPEDQGRRQAGPDRAGRAGAARSSSASRPARCRWARSRRSRTRRSRSR